MLLTAAGLTAVALLIVQRSVESQVRHNHPSVSQGKGSGTWLGLTDRAEDCAEPFEKLMPGPLNSLHRGGE
jgi:hypothetical protein